VAHLTGRGRGLAAGQDPGQDPLVRRRRPALHPDPVVFHSLRGRRVLEYWRVNGLAHAWSGGRTSGSYIDPNGPEATEIMTSFFRQHRLPHPTNDPDGRALEDNYG